MPEGSRAALQLSAQPAMTYRHHCEDHSPGSVPHPVGDAQGRFPGSRFCGFPAFPDRYVQWHEGETSTLTVAGAATIRAKTALPYSLLTTCLNRQGGTLS